MRKLMMVGLMFLSGSAAIAQISSNGPVVKDYGLQASTENPAEAKIAKEVRHEILMLPWYSLFDDIEFTVQGQGVPLSGFVTSEHAGTKSDVEKVVKHIEGVDNVTNNIRILPPSPLDARVREQVYGTLARTGGLSRYFWEAAPSMHIIVENQRVTLAGFVNSEGDKNMATIAANTVPGVFQVTNNLRVVK